MADWPFSELADYFQSEHILPVGSGSSGIMLALRLLPPGRRRVILPAATCPSVVVAILAAGAVPHPVDIQAADFNIAPRAVAEALNDDTGAVLAVDSFGYPADIAALRRAIGARPTLLIEDACQAYGGSENGLPMGNRADIGIVSFGYSKPLALEGGGLLITRSRAAHNELRLLAGRGGSGILSRLKNGLALTLMKRDSYPLFAFLSRHAALLRYPFPARLQAGLQERWRTFSGEAASMRDQSRRLAALAALIPGVRPFAYTAADWLPWRYSFTVPAEADRQETLASLRRHGIAFSRLYRPLDEFFALPSAMAAPQARRLSNEIVNLLYPSTSAALSLLNRRLASLLNDGRTRAAGFGAGRETPEDLPDATS
ncbi:MAG: DegT/DnrJ/EryC1/StrS family aminotransferase [Candidatus Aminicenantes bacterium]|nr:DegT/DnrJ/EryC1/StrS family aminotransferase [Candidatus Aminicenantes bacterium]